MLPDVPNIREIEKAMATLYGPHYALDSDNWQLWHSFFAAQCYALFHIALLMQISGPYSSTVPADTSFLSASSDSMLGKLGVRHWEEPRR